MSPAACKNVLFVQNKKIPALDLPVWHVRYNDIMTNNLQCKSRRALVLCEIAFIQHRKMHCDRMSEAM